MLQTDKQTAGKLGIYEILDLTLYHIKARPSNKTTPQRQQAETQS